MFNKGVQLGGIWRGMPYLLSFALCAIATLVISRVRLSSQNTEEPQSGGYGSILGGTDPENAIDRVGES
jgi:hypothetical protein